MSAPCPAGCVDGFAGESVCGACGGWAVIPPPDKPARSPVAAPAEVAPPEAPRVEASAPAATGASRFAPGNAPTFGDVGRESAERARLLEVERAEQDAKRARVKRAPAEGGPDWNRHRVDAAERYGPGLLGLLLYQDERLAAKREHPMSPWWRWTIASFFASREHNPLLQWILALVGRGGGKSTTLERIAIVVSLFAARTMPPSQAWQWPFISVLLSDAKRRIHEIGKLIELAWGVDAKPNSELIISTTDAAGNAIQFLSLASTVGNVSGPSTMGGTLDEATKMRTTGANPDAELVVSLAETSRARDNWIGVRCSSANTIRNAHQAAIEQGSNVVNFVATIGPDFVDIALAGFAEVAAWEAAQGREKQAAQIRAWARTISARSPNVPTWVANPSIGALASRILLETLARDADDEDIDATSYWLRECGSMPLDRDGGPNFAAQCLLARDITDGLGGKRGPRAPLPGEVMKVKGAPPGDARYAGPVQRTRVARVGWRARGVI